MNFFLYSLLGQSDNQSCHSCGQQAPRSPRLCVLVCSVGGSGMPDFFSPLNQRKGSQFGSMSGGFISTLLFKETFGECVLKDSTEPFSCTHCLILKPHHEIGIIFPLQTGQPRLKEFLELIQAFTKTSRAPGGPHRQTTSIP